MLEFHKISKILFALLHWKWHLQILALVIKKHQGLMLNCYSSSIREKNKCQQGYYWWNALAGTKQFWVALTRNSAQANIHSVADPNTSSSASPALLGKVDLRTLGEFFWRPTAFSEVQGLELKMTQSRWRYHFPAAAWTKGIAPLKMGPGVVWAPRRMVDILEVASLRL